MTNLSLNPLDAAAFRWSCRAIEKSFAARVLSGIELRIAPGEVLALLGANGAGKSTLGRIIAGLLPADAGEMSLNGQPYQPADKRQAEQLGVHIVQQELNQIGTLDIAENLFLSRLPSRWGWIKRRQLEQMAFTALQRVGLEHLPVDLPVGQLGVGERQLIEIAAALSQRCQLLVLDEPTAALTAPQVERLFEQLNRLKREGVAMIYVSHRLDEIRRIADRVAILRDGVVADQGDAAEFDVERAVTAMSATVPSSHPILKRQVSQLDQSTNRVESESKPMGSSTTLKSSAVDRFADSETLLRVQSLSALPRLKRCDLQVRRGEIVGIAGLVGAGRTEALRAIFGADRATAGEVHLLGRSLYSPFRSPAAAVRAGLGMVPEDRKQQGLLLPASIAWNVTLGNLSRWGEASDLDRANSSSRSSESPSSSRWGWLNARAEHQQVAQAITMTDVKCQDVEQPVKQLSGGNQQKVLVARWLRHHCQVLLVDEPTRGIDVDAKRTLHQVLRNWVGEGRGMVLVSSDLEELFDLADTIVVMVEGETLLTAPREACDPQTLLSRAIDARGAMQVQRHSDEATDA